MINVGQMSGEDDGSLRLGRRLERIEDNLSRILTKLETVATRPELEGLRLRLDILDRDGSKLTQQNALELRDVENRLNMCERSMATSDAVASDRKWLFMTIVGVLANTGAMAALAARVFNIHP